MSSLASMRNISISNYFIRAALANAPAAGVEPNALLTEAGIPAKLLKQPQARIPAVNFGKLLHSTIVAMGDELMGYGPRRYLPGTWNNMCYSVINCDTLGHALARYSRFFQMFEDGFQVTFVVEGDEARLIFDGATIDHPFPCYGWEQLMFNAHRFSSWLVRQHLPLIATNLAYAPPSHAAEYRNLFLGQPVYFNKARNELVMHRSLTELPLAQNEQSLRRFLKHPNLVFLVQQYKQKSWSAQVQLIINRNLVDTPSIDEIADRLELHSQTLRRRLAQEGTTFNDIKTQCRRDTALYLLGKSSLSIEQIALRTGFSETSAFTRAFKGWTGVAPQSYRQRL